MSQEGVSQLHGLRVPHFDLFIPSSSDEKRGLSIGGESNSGDPVGVTVLLNSVLAVSDGIPDLDEVISSSRSNLSVVRGESDGQDILVVGNESSGGLSLLGVPESEGSVP